MADKNGVIKQTTFSSDYAQGTKVVPKHIQELRTAIASLSTYAEKVDNCGNCVYCQSCQKCQTCQGCQSQSCQNCQTCQKCQSCQRSNCDCGDDGA